MNTGDGLDGLYALSVPETARRLGISTSLAWREVRGGSIPSVRIGDRVVVPIHALMALLTPAEPTAQQIVEPLRPTEKANA
jgi:hypothetical protein